MKLLGQPDSQDDIVRSLTVRPRSECWRSAAPVCFAGLGEVPAIVLPLRMRGGQFEQSQTNGCDRQLAFLLRGVTPLGGLTLLWRAFKVRCERSPVVMKQFGQLFRRNVLNRFHALRSPRAASGIISFAVRLLDAEGRKD